MEIEFKRANRIAEHTLIGVPDGPYPLEGGNCFSVRCDDGSYFRILNFVLENLEHLLRKKTISWPIVIKPLTPNHAVIEDPRIEEIWYKKRLCTVCTPRALLEAT